MKNEKRWVNLFDKLQLVMRVKEDTTVYVLDLTGHLTEMDLPHINGPYAAHNYIWLGRKSEYKYAPYWDGYRTRLCPILAYHRYNKEPPPPEGGIYWPPAEIMKIWATV